MARPTKIEKYGLQEKVITLRNRGKTYNEIANIVKKEDKVTLSDMAVKRFLDKYEEKVDEMAVEVIKEDKRRVMKSVNYSYDIIQSQLEISNQVLEKLNSIQDIGGLIKKVEESAIRLKENGVQISSLDFATQVALQISDNILDFTRLTKEVRENNRFLAELQTKIYDFSLLQEFVSLFIEEFKKENPELTLKILKEIKNDSRMRMLLESSERNGRP
ncbi:hypothetical protein [Tepidimicrobium xylanilyticum]|uniref:Uncharacterized protein n=1 Tax=Tepidimicrobium xylanilyticum TaxID=1123352 RepID=A0A1H3EKH0_9FIRM|nr:hypothetical protein [Tepidimicrobium xylanilyticum]GMG96243.1 hypothetical protein EN5CB1_10690 [Tepidimicrobium xylanilyticum]SDX78439.1 hypothetical protein SAMN05660923_02924 [Tepidimicrobium xylanilyticum]